MPGYKSAGLMVSWFIKKSSRPNRDFANRAVALPCVVRE